MEKTHTICPQEEHDACECAVYERFSTMTYLELGRLVLTVEPIDEAVFL